MKLYLIRHGETIGNKQEFHQVPETPLTETGIEQVKRVAKRLKSRNIGLIYASTHDRTKKTAEIISEVIGAPIELWGNLTEIRRPKEIVGKSANDPKIRKIEDLLFENFGKKGWRYSDEENFEDLLIRGKSVLNHLLDRHKDQTVLCVSHGTFIKVIIATAIFGEKLTPEVFLTLRHKMWAGNTGITLLEHDQKHGWRLLTWNDMSHL